MLIKFLILFFISLIVYQIFLANWPIIEGIENNSAPTYQNYDQSNPLILAQQNAGNIEYLKQQVTQLMGLDKEVQDISGNVVALSQQVNQLAQAQADASQQLVGNKQLAISGTQSS